MLEVVSISPAPHSPDGSRAELARERRFRLRLLESVAGRLEAANLARGKEQARLLAEALATLRLAAD